MRTRLFYAVLTAIVISASLVSTGRTQPGLEAYDRGDLEAVRSYLAHNPGETAETEYLRAALTSDAEAALSMYQRLVAKHPDSPVRQRALERIRQYYYAQGSYSRALELEETLKSSKPPVQQKAEIAEETPPPAPKPKENNSPPPEPKPVADNPPPQPPVTTTTTKVAEKSSTIVTGYSLQVGAFSKAANAEALKKSLEKAGYNVALGDPFGQNVHLIPVKVIGFKSEREALTAAGELKAKFNLPAILVPEGK
jgi:cell division protein FtsN